MSDDDLKKTEPEINPEINVEGLNMLRAMCERYTRRAGDKVVIVLDESEKAALGEFLIQAVFGFFLALDQPPQNGALPMRPAAPAAPPSRAAA
jgi:hypothetical protein